MNGRTRQYLDIPYTPKDIPLNGKLMTSVSPALIGENDFQELTNFLYTDNGIKTMNGMSIISSATEKAIRAIVTTNLPEGTVIAYQTYPSAPVTPYSSNIASELYVIRSFSYFYDIPSQYESKRILAYNYKSSLSCTVGQIVLYQSTIQQPSSFYLECIVQGTTGSSPPDFSAYNYNDKITDGTVVWIKKKGSLEGQFTVSPDNTIVFTNEHYNLIYGGKKHRTGAILNVFGTGKVINGNFDSTIGWVFGTGWLWDYYTDLTNYRARKESAATIGNLEQDISAVADETYVLKFTVKNYSAGEVTPYIGNTAGTTVSANGDYTQIITATNTDNLKFVPTTAATELCIDDVSAIRISNSKEIDITDQLTNENYDDKYCAILVEETDGNIYLCVGSPLKCRGLNVYIKTPNTTPSTITVCRYTTTGWMSAEDMTDGTNGFSQSGTISFSFIDDASGGTKELQDIPAYLYNRHLYWYLIKLSPNTGSLPTDISLYYISCATVIQAIPNLWDGTVYIPAVFWNYDGVTYTECTLPISKRDSVLIWFGATSYEPSPETTVYLTGTSSFFIGSIIRCTGFRFTFALEYGSYKWVNTNANIMTVYYWDGTDWTPVSNLVDGTSNGTCSFAHDGTVYFTPPPENEEKKTTINTDIPLYYYKVSFSVVLSSYLYLDYVETIPTTQELNTYKTCAIWNNRLVLANNSITSNKSIEVIISAPSSPYIWSGEQAITLNIGDTQDITRIVTLFSRYGTDIAEAMIMFKEKSIYYVTGTTQDDIRVYTVSNSIGTSSPYTVAVCDLGIRIAEGINRSVIIFANKSGVYFFDNSSIISISDDISDKFQSPLFEQACKSASGFYDVVNSRYHFLYWTGTPPTPYTYYEYIFDLIHKKWTTANRGDYPLVYGGTLYDDYNNPYAVGFTKNNITKLNYTNKMIDKPYNSTLTTGIKPLGNTLYAVSNIRRIKLTSTTYPNTSATLLTHCIDEDNRLSSNSAVLPISPINSSPVCAPVYQANITGSLFYYGLSIPLNSTNTDNVQPINISVLSKPVRIDFA